jgi:hypothetical protein
MALARAVGRKAIDLASLGAALGRRSTKIEAAARRTATALVVGVFATPILGWAGAFVLLVIGLLVEARMEPAPSPEARYVLVETPNGTCVAKVVAHGDRSVADFGTNDKLPVDLTVAPTALRFPAAAIKGRRLRLDNGSQGTVRIVYGSRFTDQDSVKLDPTGDSLLNGSCLAEGAAAASPSGQSKRAERTRELASGPPSKEAFTRILALFQPPGFGGEDEHHLPPWTSDEERRQSMDFAMEKLAAWDDMLRELLASGRPDEIPDWGRLVRHITFYRLDENVAAAVEQVVRSSSLVGVTIVEARKCEVLPWKRLAAPPHLHPKRLIVSDTVVSEEDWAVLIKGSFARLEALEVSEPRDEIYGSILDGLPLLSRIVCRHCRGNSLAVVLVRPALVQRLHPPRLRRQRRHS